MQSKKLKIVANTEQIIQNLGFMRNNTGLSVNFLCGLLTEMSF